jgi:hypothetical protein
MDMELWEDLRAADWLSERDNREWRDRAIRAEAQTEVLLEVVRTALDGGEVRRAPQQDRGRLHAV